jgi:D-amino peptidase
MKVFLSCDMEGVAGIVDWSQCRPGSPAYDVGCSLMLAEVNAAIDGAHAAGAAAVVVNDSHGAMFNLDPRSLTHGATYVSGRHKAGYMMEGLDGSFGAVFLVGYHGSISGPASVLSHTYNPEVIAGARLEGRLVGESGINALAALAYGVPIALLTGDSVTIEETSWFAPGVETVTTKTSLTRFAAHHLHPDESVSQIRAAAERAIQGVASMSAPALAAPYRLEVDVQTADMAEVATWVKGIERVDTRTVVIESDDAAVVFRAFVGLTYITRQAGGR